jgi:hypothetical protein
MMLHKSPDADAAAETPEDAESSQEYYRHPVEVIF